MEAGVHRERLMMLRAPLLSLVGVLLTFLCCHAQEQIRLVYSGKLTCNGLERNEAVRSDAPSLESYVLEKHYLRKHGSNAYYGQR